MMKVDMTSASIHSNNTSFRAQPLYDASLHPFKRALVPTLINHTASPGSMSLFLVLGLGVHSCLFRNLLPVLVLLGPDEYEAFASSAALTPVVE